MLQSWLQLQRQAAPCGDSLLLHPAAFACGQLPALPRADPVRGCEAAAMEAWGVLGEDRQMDQVPSTESAFVLVTVDRAGNCPEL